jgi:putative ribosome biogenesis GTPase RsgA
MNPQKFARIAESLRQYRRAELRDFEEEIGTRPVDTLYVDPLPNDAVLTSVLSSNTTFLLGRKGTGKSTIFAKAQSDLRKRKDL